MKFKIQLYYFFIGMILSGTCVQAQASLAEYDSSRKERFIVSYALDIKSGKKNGVAESYNGAIKTIFVNGSKARGRLVSLMRVQSIFYTVSENGSEEKITMVKESGKDSYKKNLTNDEWQQLNKKYNNVSYEFSEDSVDILDRICKKAIVHLKDGKKIIAWYTTAIKNKLYTKLEPAFAGIPGLVLAYEYENNDAVFRYTATSLSFDITGPEIFKIP